MDLQQCLMAYGRFLELEDLLPQLQAEQKELREQLREAKLDRDWKKIELMNRENPGFFQRMLGKTEEKREAAYLEHREAAALCSSLETKLQNLEHRIQEGERELGTLTESREIYARICKEESPSPEEAAAVFGPIAVAAANNCIQALEGARRWMQMDAVRKGVSEKNRKYEFLALAEQNARRLCFLLELLPAEQIPLGGYLKYPDSYITNVTSEFKQLDRLELAQNQVRACRDAVKVL